MTLLPLCVVPTSARGAGGLNGAVQQLFPHQSCRQSGMSLRRVCGKHLQISERVQVLVVRRFYAAVVGALRGISVSRDAVTGDHGW